MSVERVQKILAQAGIASRRKAEELITSGEVTINGKIAKLGDKAELGKDSIKVKGKLLQKAESPVYIALYKPRGVISMLVDEQGRPTLADYLSKVKTRVFPVGRLDFNSEGLILLTNDGAVSQQLQKSEELIRVYHVKVKGHPDAEMIARIERGTRKGDDGRNFKPHSIRIRQKLEKKTVLEVVLMGSGAFDLRSLFETRGFLVEKSVRTAIGQIKLGALAPGEFRVLKQSQLKALIEQPELGLRRLEQDKPMRVKEREKNPVAEAPAVKIRPLPVSQRTRPGTSASRPAVRIRPVRK